VCELHGSPRSSHLLYARERQPVQPVQLRHLALLVLLEQRLELPQIAPAHRRRRLKRRGLLDHRAAVRALEEHALVSSPQRLVLVEEMERRLGDDNPPQDVPRVPDFDFQPRAG
jgi:hypothetical protein